MKHHHPDCPAAQAWDVGELLVRCDCDTRVGPLFNRLSRKEHPPESKQAASSALSSGAVTRARALALNAVRLTPGLTCTELEHTHQVEGRTFGRRLRELEDQGLVRRDKRKCRITGHVCATWWPT